MRKIHLLYVGEGAGRLEKLLAEAPGNWQVEASTLPEVIGRLHGLAGLDLLLLDFEAEATAGAPGWLDLLRIANETSESLPVIALTGASGLPTTLAARLNLEHELQPAFLCSAQDAWLGRVNLVEQISLRLRQAGRVENRQAILITHGTDTMAWAFAYLRYALSGLTVNVALTGSQLPLEGTFSLSDALGNLRTSVYLLNRLVPGKLFLVFNEGRAVYSGGVNKIRKWDQDAFDGRLAGAVGAEKVDFFDRDWISIVYPEQLLQALHLIRTGGTIESAPGQGGSLVPGADFIESYLQQSLRSEFMTLLDHQELQISRDSSNLSLEDWERLACLVGQISGCACDRRFDPAVKVVYANPFLTEADYLSQFAACTGGVLLAGYGAGNANTLLASGRSALPAIRQACQQGKLVALSSQVPLESYDLDYQVGRELVLAGGLPCGELTLADAQVKLSYLLGHRAEIEAAALAAGLQPRQALVTAFLAGLRLRKKSSQAWLVNALSIPGSPVRLAAADPFVGRPFADGLNQVIQLLQ